MSAFHAWAPKPPLGWNGRASLGATVTEEHVKAQADSMSTHLARFGFRYILLDAPWYDPNAEQGGAAQTVDAWGRLMPAPSRFPSCARGLEPLAVYVHERGLALGVHLPCGIPRRAVEQDLPIFGRSERARQLARTDGGGAGSRDMYGLDTVKPGAQAYYDSVFAQLAAWGVDYVNVDLSGPYHERRGELEAIRSALDKAGRPMLLGLSPGAGALDAAEHVKQHANLCGISDACEDSWDALAEQFERLRDWNPHHGAGFWPDAGALPLGVLEPGRRSSLSADEQRMVMSLWAIARSPLMLGGDMTSMDDLTLSLLTNRGVLSVSQGSRDNRPLFERDGLFAWVARASGSEDVYLALFNARDRAPLALERAVFVGELRGGSHALETLLVDVPVTPGSRLSLVADDGDVADDTTSRGQHAVVWGEPILRGPSGDLSLTELAGLLATSRGGRVRKNQTEAGHPLLLGGRPLDAGLAVHTRSVISFQVPVGYTRLIAECGFEGHTLPERDASRSRCLVFDETPERASGSAGEGCLITVTARELGFEGPVTVHDLWEERELGAADGVIGEIVPWHGCALFRVAPRRGSSPGAAPVGHR